MYLQIRCPFISTTFHVNLLLLNKNDQKMCLQLTNIQLKNIKYPYFLVCTCNVAEFNIYPILSDFLCAIYFLSLLLCIENKNATLTSKTYNGVTQRLALGILDSALNMVCHI